MAQEVLKSWFYKIEKDWKISSNQCLFTFWWNVCWDLTSFLQRNSKVEKFAENLLKSKCGYNLSENMKLFVTFDDFENYKFEFEVKS